MCLSTCFQAAMMPSQCTVVVIDYKQICYIVITRSLAILDQCAKWDIVAQSGSALARSLGTVAQDVWEGFVRRTWRESRNAAGHTPALALAKTWPPSCCHLSGFCISAFSSGPPSRSKRTVASLRTHETHPDANLFVTNLLTTSSNPRASTVSAATPGQ